MAGSGAPGGSEPVPSGPGFERILIVGLGLIGGSLALAFRRAGFQGRIAAVSGPEAIAEGRRLGAIEAGVDYGALASAAEEADLIVLATPIHRILEHLSVLGRA